jgi:hypothetical protein
MSDGRPNEFLELLRWRFSSRDPAALGSLSARLREASNTPLRLDGRLKVGDELKRNEQEAKRLQAEFQTWLPIRKGCD